MKYLISIVLFSLLFIQSHAQSATDSSVWQKVIITRNTDDVVGLKRIQQLSASTSRVYGNQSKLRQETEDKLKQQAAQLGASVVLVSIDDFAMSPINNINMVGVAYTSDSCANTQAISEVKPVVETPVNWETVLITRNTDDVKGLQRVQQLNASTSRVYGKQSKLREETEVKLKQQAAQLGASVVLINIDEFAMSPINNINMVGVAYK